MVFWNYLSYRYPLLIYFSCSFILLLLQLQKYLVIETRNANPELYEGNMVYESTIQATITLGVLFSYFVISIFLFFSYKEYKNHVKRYQSFKDYALDFQQKNLSNIYCTSCRKHSNMDFQEEKMLHGMRWIFVACPKCDAVNKKRLS